MKYRNLITRNVVTVIDMFAAGKCKKTMGMSMVIYKENEYSEISSVMENREFHSIHELVTK